MINEGKQIALKLACLAPLLTLLLADVYVSAIGATGLSVGLACGLTLSENAWSLKFSWKSKRRLFVALLVIICALPLSVPYVPIAIGSPSLILYFALSTSASVLFVDTAEHYEKEDCRPTKPRGRPSISVAELCSAFPAALFAAYLKLALTAAQRAYLESSLLDTLVWASWGPSLMFLASLALSKMFRVDFIRSALDIAALACPLILSYGILLLGLGPFGHAQLLRFGSKSPEPSALYFALALLSMGTTLIGYKQWSDRTTSAQLIGLSLSADGLSRREAEVVAAALAGDSMQKTAARLGVSIGAIAEYRRRALKKAGADSMLQLVSKSREPANAAKDKRGSKNASCLVFGIRGHHFSAAHCLWSLCGPSGPRPGMGSRSNLAMLLCPCDSCRNAAFREDPVRGTESHCGCKCFRPHRIHAHKRRAESPLRVQIGGHGGSVSLYGRHARHHHCFWLVPLR